MWGSALGDQGAGPFPSEQTQVVVEAPWPTVMIVLSL